MGFNNGLILLALFAVVHSHTWLQCTDYKTDGSCGGFIRNWFARNVPAGVSPDDFYTNKLLGQTPTFEVCKRDTQANPVYTAQFPKAVAKAGSTLRTMYTPNGHSQPGDRGRNTAARIHWNRGPSGPGALLKFRREINETNEMSRANYANGCATTGDVASLPCVNSYTIPRDTPPGTYQFVWYWPYDSNPNQRPYGEEYFSCFEIQVLAADGVTPPPPPPPTPTSNNAPAPTSNNPPASGTCYVNPSAAINLNGPISDKCSQNGAANRCADNLCCSQYGYCGSTNEYCNNNRGDWRVTACSGSNKLCYRGTTNLNLNGPLSVNARCGNSAKGSRCPDGQCCSQYGYCGTTNEHCAPNQGDWRLVPCTGSNNISPREAIYSNSTVDEAIDVEFANAGKIAMGLLSVAALAL